MKNRMREIRTSGSVRDGAGDNPVYSAGGGVPAETAIRMGGAGESRGRFEGDSGGIHGRSRGGSWESAGRSGGASGALMGVRMPFITDALLG